jgi:2-C-methyl-D-erythritol 4-phosphate cytidylyltransferase
LVTGAGQSRRFGAGNKLLQPLEGRPLLAWTLEAFEQFRAVDELYLTAPADDVDTYRTLLAQVAPRTGRQVFVGGSERQESIFLALQALAADPPDHLAIHDGARPLVEVAVLERCHGALASGAAVPGHAPTDTIKRVGPEAYVVDTLERGSLVAVQTPQVFAWALLWEAHQRAKQDGVLGTDDAALVEHYGGRVKIVEGQRTNIKVTTPMDLWLAGRLLRERNR